MHNLKFYNLKLSFGFYEIQNLMEVFFFFYWHTNQCLVLLVYFYPPSNERTLSVSQFLHQLLAYSNVCVNKHVRGCVSAFIQRVRPAERGTETACSWGEVSTPPWYTSVLQWDSWSEHTHKNVPFCSTPHHLFFNVCIHIQFKMLPPLHCAVIRPRRVRHRPGWWPLEPDLVPVVAWDTCKPAVVPVALKGNPFHSVRKQQVSVNSCLCRLATGGTASGTREREAASVSASWLGSDQRASRVNTSMVSHQTSQLHPVIINIE